MDPYAGLCTNLCSPYNYHSLLSLHQKTFPDVFVPKGRGGRDKLEGVVNLVACAAVARLRARGPAHGAHTLQRSELVAVPGAEPGLGFRGFELEGLGFRV